MKIRKAVLEDAEGIAKVHVDSWRTTYKEIIPSSYLNNLSYAQRTELWKKNISKEENYVVVAEEKTDRSSALQIHGKEKITQQKIRET